MEAVRGHHDNSAKADLSAAVTLSISGICIALVYIYTIYSPGNGRWGKGERGKQFAKAILELSNQRNKQDSSNATEASSTEIVGKLGTPQDPQGVDR